MAKAGVDSVKVRGHDVRNDLQPEEDLELDGRRYTVVEMKKHTERAVRLRRRRAAAHLHASCSRYTWY